MLPYPTIPTIPPMPTAPAQDTPAGETLRETIARAHAAAERAHAAAEIAAGGDDRLRAGYASGAATFAATAADAADLLVPDLLATVEAAESARRRHDRPAEDAAVAANLAWAGKIRYAADAADHAADAADRAVNAPRFLDLAR